MENKIYKIATLCWFSSQQTNLESLGELICLLYGSPISNNSQLKSWTFIESWINLAIGSILKSNDSFCQSDYMDFSIPCEIIASRAHLQIIQRERNLSYTEGIIRFVFSFTLIKLQHVSPGRQSRTEGRWGEHERLNWWSLQEFIDLPPSQFSVSHTTSILQFSLHSERDYGTIQCQAINEIGHQLEPCVVKLLPKGEFYFSFSDSLTLWSCNLFKSIIISNESWMKE